MQSIGEERKNLADAIGGTLVQTIELGNVLDKNHG
jgi:hypothetical protein